MPSAAAVRKTSIIPPRQTAFPFPNKSTGLRGSCAGAFLVYNRLSIVPGDERMEKLIELREKLQFLRDPGNGKRGWPPHERPAQPRTAADQRPTRTPGRLAGPTLRSLLTAHQSSGAFADSADGILRDDFATQELAVRN